MKFNQYYLECLSHASYLIGDEASGKAVVVDPQRDVGQYVLDAKASGLVIEHVIETHFHADFLSGHLELAAATGADIVYSSVAETEFASVGVHDGERYALGDLVLEFRHTPGHTPESLSIVIWEKATDPAPWGVLTGDTLFIGDVGRPDLLSSLGFSEDELASSLYDSLHSQLLTLPDKTKVFPSHGAGSSCGKNLSSELESTIGDQKRSNYALQTTDKHEFINLVTSGQNPAPPYFVHDATLNRMDRTLLDETSMPAALSLSRVLAAQETGSVVVDARDPEVFARGHLRDSINVGLGGRYAEFAGSVVAPTTSLILITEPGTEIEARNRLARIGFDRVEGYLQHPQQVMLDSPSLVAPASRLTARHFEISINTVSSLQIIDVRNPGEIESGFVEGAQQIPVSQLNSRLGEVDLAKPIVVYCAGGYRSSVAASLLRSAGAADVSDLIGGFGAWRDYKAGAMTAEP